MKFKRFGIAIMAMAIMVSTLAISANAAESEEILNDAIYRPTSSSTRASDPNYNLYSGKTNLYDGYEVLRGCKGWTRLTDKKTGSDQIYHNTTASAEDPSGYEYLAKNSGLGAVHASTGILYNTAIWYTWIYYSY